eukprot:5501539-Pyramimonas_sp.AAC.1
MYTPTAVRALAALNSLGDEVVSRRGQVEVARLLALGNLADRNELLEQLAEVAERPLGGAVHGGAVGVVVHLHEDAVKAGGHTRARNGRDQIAEATGGHPTALEGLAGRLLQGVGDVRHHGAAGVTHPHQ